MAKASSPTGIDAFHPSYRTSAFLDFRFAAQFVRAVVIELGRALTAEAEYQGLARRSDQQLTRMGLTHSDLPDHIRRRYYA